MPIKSLIQKLLGLGLALWGTASVLFFLSHLLPSSSLPPGMGNTDATAYGSAATWVQQQVKTEYLKRKGLDQPLFYFKVVPRGLQPYAVLSTAPHPSAFIERASKRHGHPATRTFLAEWAMYLQNVKGEENGATKMNELHAHLTEWALQRTTQGSLLAERRFLAVLAKTGQKRAPQITMAWHQLMESPPQVMDLMPVFYWVGTGNQYHRWLKGIITGNLGASTRDYEPVKDKLLESLKVSASIALPAAFMAIFLSCLAGFWLCLPDSAVLKTVVTQGLYVLDSLPGFMITLGIFAIYLTFGGTLASFDVRSSIEFSGTMLLGSVSVALFLLPFLTLFFQKSLYKETQQPYMRTALAKGLPFAAALAGHAVPNALASVTVVVADVFASLIAGVLIVEVTFSLPGTGSLLAHSLVSQDFATVIGLTLTLLLFRTTLMWLAEVANGLLDPRMQ